jgi:hypothetical protein
VWAIPVLVVSAFLLLTFGAAIVATPVTLPLLYLVVRRTSRRGVQVAAIVVAVLTVAELAWALTYVAVEDAEPWIWLDPLLAAVGAGAFLGRMRAVPSFDGP